MIQDDIPVANVYLPSMIWSIWITIKKSGRMPGSCFVWVHRSPKVGCSQGKGFMGQHMPMMRWWAWYRWWKKSCTTWDVQNPVNNGIWYTTYQLVQDFFHQQYHMMLKKWRRLNRWSWFQMMETTKGVDWNVRSWSNPWYRNGYPKKKDWEMAIWNETVDWIPVETYKRCVWFWHFACIGKTGLVHISNSAVNLWKSKVKTNNKVSTSVFPSLRFLKYELYPLPSLPPSNASDWTWLHHRFGKTGNSDRFGENPKKISAESCPILKTWGFYQKPLFFYHTLSLVQYMTRWWFQRFFMFTLIWGRFPFWLIFFKGVETTN